MEEKPKNYETLETPTVEVVTAIGRIACHWANTTLQRFENPYDDYIEYSDGETLHELNVTTADWEILVANHFPWEYWPDLECAGDESIEVRGGNNTYHFKPSNTKLRLFTEEKFNHAEHKPTPSELKGIRVAPALWRMMFKGNYPIKFLPYVDRATKEWADDMGIK